MVWVRLFFGSVVPLLLILFFVLMIIAEGPVTKEDKDH